MIRVFLISTAIFLVACTTPPPSGGDFTLNRSRMDPTRKRPDKQRSDVHNSREISAQRAALVAEANALIGAKYRYGGNNPARGFDCSGFTCYVLSRFDVTLPRSSSEQSRIGKRKDIRSAEEGDLIFFGTGKRVTHVGIVVAHRSSKLEVIHSTSSSGVRVDDVYQSAYWHSRALWAVDISQVL